MNTQTASPTCYGCHAAKATTTQTIDYANRRVRIVIEVPMCAFCADPVDPGDDVEDIPTEDDDLGAIRFAEWMAEVDADESYKVAS